MKFSFLHNKLFKESLWISLTEYLTLGVFVITNFMINKTYGTAQMGIFNISYSTAQVAILGIGGAFTQILRREISIDNKLRGSFLKNVLRLRIILIFFSILILIFMHYTVLINKQYLSKYIILLTSAKGFDLLNETFFTTYQCCDKTKLYVFLKTGNALLLLSTILFLFYTKSNIYFIYLSLNLIPILFVILNIFYFFKEKDAHVSNTFNENITKFLLKESWPLIINSIIFQLSSRISIFIILSLLGEESVGVFASSLIGVNLFTSVSNSISTTIFPKISNMYHTMPQNLMPFLKRIIKHLLPLGIGFTALYFISIPTQISILGKLPTYSKTIFCLMALSIPASLITGIIGNCFTVIREQKKGMYVSFFVLMINSGLFYLSIHYYNNIGAAVAYLLSTLIQVISIYFVLNFYVTKKLRSDTSYTGN